MVTPRQTSLRPERSWPATSSAKAIVQAQGWRSDRYLDGLRDRERHAMQTSEVMQDARRAMEICNACRYCEGFCAVFPAMELRRDFSNGDLTYLANLCHNCRGCYY